MPKLIRNWSDTWGGLECVRGFEKEDGMGCVAEPDQIQLCKRRVADALSRNMRAADACIHIAIHLHGPRGLAGRIGLCAANQAKDQQQGGRQANERLC